MGSKTIPKKKKCKKAKWLSEEALQIAVKRREAKSKGEKERYTHLNAQFQRIARRDKKAFLSDQCKEIKENNRWERLEISSRKLEIPSEHFMQRWAQWRTEMVMDLTEAEDFKNRWIEYTEELYKIDLHDPDNHYGVITHLEPDILEWEVKWALGSTTTKLVKVMEFQLSYFKSLKMMLWKYCTQYASKFGKLSSGHRTGKGQFSFQSQRKATPKNAQTTIQLHSSHTLGK